jgi:uncharacterized membrane protein
MDRLFWILATLVFAAVVHISYVLYAERLGMSGFINEAVASSEHAGVSSQAALNVFPSGMAQNAAAYMCPFDLTGGAFQFSASMPEGMWVVSVYTRAGENIFAVNDQQAGTQAFTITIKKQRALGGLFSPGDDIGRAGEEWHVESPEPKGLVVAWAAVDQDAKRPRIEAALGKSVCKGGLAG